MSTTDLKTPTTQSDGTDTSVNQLASACQQARDMVESVNDLTDLLNDDATGCDNVIARSSIMRNAIHEAQRFAKSSAALLLTGESGTGKEIIARLIHRHSTRSSGPYVGVNCAALSETLIESELFGHERGAFTGAVDVRAGRFEAANGGTILLDEISEIPISLQAKLLRVLEEQEYQRVGSNKNYHVDVRVIATTNRCLREEIAAGRFRADLYYRLNVLQLTLPALRQRKDDIQPLVEHFVDQFRDESETPVRDVSESTLKILRAYDWPGNVRQLRNMIHRACIMSMTGKIEPGDVPMLDSKGVSMPATFDNMKLEEIERHVIVSNLRRFHGNKSATARHLGVTSRTLANKMKRYRELGYV